MILVKLRTCTTPRSRLIATLRPCGSRSCTCLAAAVLMRTMNVAKLRDCAKSVIILERNVNRGSTVQPLTVNVERSIACSGPVEFCLIGESLSIRSLAWCPKFEEPQSGLASRDRRPRKESGVWKTPAQYFVYHWDDQRRDWQPMSPEWPSLLNDFFDECALEQTRLSKLPAMSSTFI